MLTLEQFKAQQTALNPKFFARDMVPDGMGGQIDREAKYWRDQYAQYTAGFGATAGGATTVNAPNITIIATGASAADVAALVGNQMTQLQQAYTAII
jgi:hypothetical protein